MTPNEAIKLMLFAMNQGDHDGVYKVADNYVKTLSITGEASRNIRQQIARKPAKMVMLSELPSQVKNLLIAGDLPEETVYLNPLIKQDISDLLTEWKHADLLKGHNLPVRSKILLHGPTGNGKTTIARNIARLSDLPFVEVNSDMMIGSHIGSTAANIHNVFKSLKEKCVLFWDEVDTIGRARGKGDSSAGVENDRMVNSMIVNMEKLDHNIVFIGATNRIDVLDPAFLRRFDATIHLPEPTESEKDAFARMLAKYFAVPVDYEIDLNKLNSFSQIKQGLVAYARRYVLGVVEKGAEG